MENSSVDVVLSLTTLAAVVSTLIIGLYAQWKDSARNRARTYESLANVFMENVAIFHAEIMTTAKEEKSIIGSNEKEKELARVGTLIELMMDPNIPKEKSVIDLMYKIYNEKDEEKRLVDGDAMLSLVREIIHEHRRKAISLF